MKKVKKLFEKNLLFRYVSTFLGMIFLFSLLLIVEKTIPNGSVKKNIMKSEEYYQEYFKQLYGNLNTLKNRHSMIDIPGDFYHLSILYLEDNKHPVKEFVEMNKDSQLASKVISGKHFTGIERDSDYSRYWNGHLIILKPLLSFFTMRTISIFYFILLSIAFVWLAISLFRHSKLLAVLFMFASIGVNLFYASRCDNFTHVLMISMISSVILIKMYEKNSTKYVDLLFLIGGMLTAYFDMLSCGTLPCTLPLFIYITLHIKDGKKLSFKLFARYILLWLFGGVLTYAAKWLILVLHYHGGFREHVLEPMKVRVGSGNMTRGAMFIDSMKLVPHYIFPYNLYGLKYTLLGLGLVCFGYLLREKKNRILYIYLFIVCLIPYIRYYFLAEHSNYHNYFTYRAFLPVIMFVFFCMSMAFVSIKKNYFKNKKKEKN